MRLGLFLWASIGLSAPVRFERRSTYSNSTVHGPENNEFITFTIGETPYVSFVSHNAPFTAPVEPFGINASSSPVLTTVVHGCSIKGMNKFYQDDVWSEEFAENILFVPSSNCSSLDVGMNNDTITLLPYSQASVPSGPYLAYSGGLYPVYRLYRDTQAAFTTGLLNVGSDSFVEMSSVNGGSIPVPSRLYFGPKSDSKPLNGVRVGVKDLYDVAGVRSGCGSRPYYETYAPAASNSYPVQKLLDLGAIIVGKTIMNPFANMGWAEQLEPFNPRGDGFQDPSGSSTGSGAAIAAYSWLDATIGSDTGGSVRGPAGMSGVFGIRPTFDIMDLTGVMPMSDLLDTPGFFTRDASSFLEFGSAWYALNSSDKVSLPSTLLSPADFWKSLFTNDNVTEKGSKNQAKIFSSFLDQLSSFLGTNQTTVSFDTYWNKTSGVNDSVSNYLNETYVELIADYQHRVLGSPFNKTYQEKNQRSPFIDPSVMTRWNWAQSQPNGTYDHHVHRKEVFTEFMDKFLPGDCSKILVYPQSSGEPSLRESYPGTPIAGPPFGFSALSLANLGSHPDMVIPIGETNFHSNITHSQEWLPLTLSLVGGSGCDLQLMYLAKQLEDNGLIQPVNTGSSLWKH